MNCPTCGLEQPDGLPHISLDNCQVALVAAQDAIRSILTELTKQTETKLTRIKGWGITWK